MLLRKVTLLLTLIGLTPMFGCSKTQDGSQDNPFLIASQEDFLTLRDKVNSGISFEGMFFKQISDIYLDPSTYWTPIGIGDNYFGGYYDGNGFKISGVLTDPAREYSALFAQASGTIVNINLVDSIISATKMANGICNFAKKSGQLKIVHCINGAKLVAPLVGGIAGDLGRVGEIYGCYSYGELIGEGYSLVSYDCQLIDNSSTYNTVPYNETTYAGFIGTISSPTHPEIHFTETELFINSKIHDTAERTGISALELREFDEENRQISLIPNVIDMPNSLERTAIIILSIIAIMAFVSLPVFVYCYPKIRNRYKEKKYEK